MSSKLRLLALAAGLLLPAAAAGAATPSGYFDSADAPLVAPNEYNTGAAGTTLPRQQASGYFASADASLVPPTTAAGDANQTLAKQQTSGYFPDAGAPLVPPTITVH